MGFQGAAGPLAAGGFAFALILPASLLSGGNLSKDFYRSRLSPLGPYRKLFLGIHSRARVSASGKWGFKGPRALWPPEAKK